MEIRPDRFREVMGGFATGISVDSLERDQAVVALLLSFRRRYLHIEDGANGPVQG